MERCYPKDWHVGEPNFLAADQTSRWDDVIKVQADGDELTYILENFTNIPTRKNARMQVWTGETAQFIAYHLV